jgi:tetratricopeptide (TPR) repeat protein
MCMQFNLTKRHYAALIAFGIVASPVLIVGGIFYGIPVATAGAVRDHFSLREHRRHTAFLITGQEDYKSKHFRAVYARYRLESAQVLQKLIAEAQDENKTDAQLEAAIVLSSMRAFHQAMAYFDRALTMERQRQTGSGHDTHHPLTHATAAFFGGKCAEQLRQWNTAAKLFAEAVKVASAMIDPAAPPPALPFRVTEAQTHGALAKYLNATYAVRSKVATDEVSARQWERLLTEALQEVQLAVKCGEADGESGADLALARSVEANVRYQLGLRAAPGNPDAVEVDPVQLLEARLLLDRVVDAVSAAMAAQPTAVDPLLAALPLLEGSAGDSAIDAGDVSPLSNEHANEEVGAGDVAVKDMTGGTGVSLAEALSLRAQIQFALGNDAAATMDRDAAIALDAHVPHSGLLSAEEAAEAGVADLRVGLLRLWPLPEDVAMTETAAHGHDFVEVKFHKPTWCDYCMNFIRKRKGLECKTCKYQVHTEEEHAPCKKHAAAQPCVPAGAVDCETEGRTAEDRATAAAKRVASHQHVLRMRRIHTPHNCTHCNKFIMAMTTAFQCNVCNCFTHEDCAEWMTGVIVDVPDKSTNKY